MAKVAKINTVAVNLSLRPVLQLSWRRPPLHTAGLRPRVARVNRAASKAQDEAKVTFTFGQSKKMRVTSEADTAQAPNRQMAAIHRPPAEA